MNSMWRTCAICQCINGLVYDERGLGILVDQATRSTLVCSLTDVSSSQTLDGDDDDDGGDGLFKLRRWFLLIVTFTVRPASRVNSPAINSVDFSNIDLPNTLCA